ncbi:MAG: glycosyltransferase family A protein [Desulfovibrio sp.]
MASQPLVSVIIPTYNYAAFLPQAVASVLDQREQGIDVEVIVVDDGSTDNTAEVAESLGPDIVFIQQDNSGPSRARNTGLRAAHGDFVAFLDADDLFSKGLLASHLRVFEAQPELDMTICRCMNLQQGEGERLLTLWSLVNSHWDVHACTANLAPIHCFLLRMACARRAGYFDESIRHCEDQEYWLRCYGMGAKVGVNPDGLVLYRKHGDNSTSNMKPMYVHDSLMHEKVGRLLAELPEFPLHAKCAGWLAHAAGCLVSSGYLCELDPERSLVMQDFFTKAVLTAAPLFSSKAQSGISADMRHLQNYYGGRCLRVAKWSGLQLTSPAAKAVMVLERMFPRMADLPADALDARLRSTYARLCVIGLPPQVSMG